MMAYGVVVGQMDSIDTKTWYIACGMILVLATYRLLHRAPQHPELCNQLLTLRLIVLCRDPIAHIGSLEFLSALEYCV